MYQKLALLILSVLLAPLCYCQLHYRDITFPEALQMSKQSQKIIFLQYESATCNECNEVADKGIGAQEVSERIQSAFIPIRITAESPDRESVRKQYNMSMEFGSLFIDWNGNLLHSYHRTTTRGEDYMEQITIALNKAGEALKLTELEKTYKQLGGFAILEMVISKRESLGLNYDNELDEYVGILPADSLNSQRTLQFIIHLAPVLGSKAYYKMYNDTAAFRQAWKTIAVSERIQPSGNIAYRSMNKAIAERNEEYANWAANYAVANANAKGEYANRVRLSTILPYYRETGDSDKYIKAAIEYYDRFIMTIDVASLKKRDSMLQKASFDNASFRDTIINGKAARVRRVVQGPTQANVLSSELSNAAKTLVRFSTKPEFIAIAYQWSKRALEFYESPGDLEIHADLCRKLGYEQEATRAEEKRASLRKKMGFPLAPLKEEHR
jgi:hypothetical protein